MRQSNEAIADLIKAVTDRARQSFRTDNDGNPTLNFGVNASGPILLLKQALKMYAPADSTYLRESVGGSSDGFAPEPHVLHSLTSILDELEFSYRSGLLQTVREIVRAEVYGDLLADAKSLLDEGRKGPSAVVIGALFEENLRKLCGRFGVATDTSDGKPKKANQMNQDLHASGAYDKFTMKSVTAWLDVRNAAAHGKFDEFDETRVENFHHFVEEFLANHLA